MTDLLDMISLGNRNIDHLSEPSELRAAAEQVTEVASDFGTSTLMAASSAADASSEPRSSAMRTWFTAYIQKQVGRAAPS